MELILQTEKEALRLRLAAVLLSAIGLYLARLDQWLPAVLLALGYLIYVVLLRAVLLPRVTTPWVVYGMIGADVCAVSLGLMVTGRIGSPLFALFPALILYYSIHLGYATSLAAATASSLAYSAVALVTGEAESFGAFLGFQVPLFYLLAFMGGFLAQKRFEERREKESLQEAVGLERGARTLLEVTKALSNTLEMESVLQRVLSSSLGLPGAEAGIVAVRRKEDGRLTVRASSLMARDLGAKEIAQVLESPEKGSPSLLALETLDPQPVRDLQRDGAHLPSWLRALPHRSLLVAPLVHQERAVGVLYLLGQEFGADTISKAKTLGELAGMALFNALVYEESQNRVSHLREEFEGLVGRVERLRNAQKKRVIEADGLLIDLVRTEVSLNGRAISLSPIEFELLSALAESVGEPLSHDTLLRLVWGPGQQGQPNVVDVSIHRLRRKIEDDPSHPRRIVTVRGIGYMLATSAAASTSSKIPLRSKKVI